MPPRKHSTPAGSVVYLCLRLWLESKVMATARGWLGHSGWGTGTSWHGTDPRTFGGHKLECQSSNSSRCTRLSLCLCLCPGICIYVYIRYIPIASSFVVVVVFVVLLLLFFHLIYYQLCSGSFCWHNLTRPTICCP